MGADGGSPVRRIGLALAACTAFALLLAWLSIATAQQTPQIPAALLPPGASPIWDWYGPPPAPTCGPGGPFANFDVGLGMRVYVQAVAGVSGDAWYICGQNAAGVYELVPLATAP